MTRLLFLFFVITYFDLFFVVNLNIGFGKALPLSTILLFLISFVCNLLGNLTYYKYVIVVLVAIFTTISIIKLKKEKDYKKYLKLFINPSLLIYSLLFFYLYFNSLNKALINIDDLTTWAPVIKGIVKNGQFYSLNQVISSYPPYTLWSIALINYMLGGFSEQVCLFAIGILLISYVLPVLDNFKLIKEDLIKIILSTSTLLACLLTVNIIDGDQLVFLFNSIYLDWIMALIYTYCFYLIFKFNNTISDYISFGLVSTAFLFTKQLSLPLYLVLLVSLITRLIITKKLNVKKLLPILLTIVILYVGWNLIYSNYSSKSALSETIRAIKLASSTFFSTTNINTIKQFINAIFTRPIIFKPISFSYVSYNTILFLLSLVYVYLGTKKKEDYTEAILMYLGSFGYALVMVVAYTTMFDDGHSLPMFSRYMQTYTLSYLVLVAMLWISLEINNIKRLILLVISVLLIEPASISTLNINNELSYYKSERENIETFVKDEYKGENVLVIGQNQMAYKGAATAIFKDYYPSSFVVPITYSEYSGFTGEDLANYMCYFDYVLITDYNDYFASNCWYKLTDVPLYNSTLYKVVRTENNVEFRYVYIWDK